MALSKERKQEVIAQYESWIKDSEAIILAEYTGMNMPNVDELRAKFREAGGEFHIVKNTLLKIAFNNAGIEAPEEYFVNSTAVGVAFEDPPGMAKAMVDFGKDVKALKLKGGFLGENNLTAQEITSLAELPPLPVARAQLLGVISAPASKLVRMINEPGRQLAQVVKAYSEREAPAAA